MKDNTTVAQIFDDFNRYNHSLIFLTTALRSMFETGNVQDPDLDVGVFNYMSELTDGFTKLEQSLQEFLHSKETQATSEPNQGLAIEHKSEQET